MPHLYSSPCHFCGCLTEHEQVDLDRRVERLTVVQHDDKPVTSIQISQRETLYSFCDGACWTAAEPGLIDEFGLSATYPPFGFVSSCSRCGGSVNRTLDYVCLSISTMTYQQDGSPVAVCSDDRDWAVFCNGCDQPDGGIASDIAIDQVLRVPEHS